MVITPTPAPLSVSQPEWQTWASLPWLARAAPGSNEIQLCLRLVESATTAESYSAFVRQELPEIASEFAAQWVGIVRRSPDWKIAAEFGRQPVESLPIRFLTETLDRGVGGSVSVDAGASGG